MVFILGVLGFLYEYIVVLATLLFIVVLVGIFKKTPRILKTKIFSQLKESIFKNKLSGFLVFLLLLLATVNLVGTLGPELAFDALWYHLTLPKLYLVNHSIFHIPGSLLYYSDTPKLLETFYISALSFDAEILAKLIHFSFGILTVVVIYKLSRKFLLREYSLLASIIFYSNLVVAWQSITAYVDLGRTFFEIMALWGFLNFTQKQEKKWLVISSIMLGFAISTKLLAFSSLFIFSILIAASFSESKSFVKKTLFYHPRWVTLITNILVYWFISIIIVSPWLVFSLLNTGNPVYPFFTDIYRLNFDASLLNPTRFIVDLWMDLSDPISPIYLITLPLIVLLFSRFKKEIKIIAIYSLLAYLMWYFVPRTGGGRFLMPYLPAFSILIAGTIEIVQDKWIKTYLFIIIIVISIISIGYRALANKKYLPVVFGQQSQSEFLIGNLNFSFGDFYDVDDYFKKNIKKSDRVLIYGVHNLYYLNFPFIHESWVKKGDIFNYIITQNSDLPERFSDGYLIYENPITHVKLYFRDGKRWVY